VKNLPPPWTRYPTAVGPNLSEKERERDQLELSAAIELSVFAYPVKSPPVPSAATIDRPAWSMDFRASAGSIWILVLMTSMASSGGREEAEESTNRERRDEEEEGRARRTSHHSMSSAGLVNETGTVSKKKLYGISQRSRNAVELRCREKQPLKSDLLSCSSSPPALSYPSSFERPNLRKDNCTYTVQHVAPARKNIE